MESLPQYSSTPPMIEYIQPKPDKQRQMIRMGHIKSWKQIDEYGRWEYMTIYGQKFISSINPAAHTLFSAHV